MLMMAHDSTRWQVATYPTFSQLRNLHVSIIAVVIFTFSADQKKWEKNNGIRWRRRRWQLPMQIQADEDVVRTNVRSAS